VARAPAPKLCRCILFACFFWQEADSGVQAAAVAALGVTAWLSLFQAGVSSDSRCSVQGGLQGWGGLLGRGSCDSLPSGLRSCGSGCAHCLSAVLGAGTGRPAALRSNTWAGHALRTPLSPHLHAALLLPFAGAAYTYRAGLHATLPPLVRHPPHAGKVRHSRLRSSPGACEVGRPCYARSVTTQGSRAMRRQASAGPPRVL